MAYSDAPDRDAPSGDRPDGRPARLARQPIRVAMLSMHTSPLAPLGGRETGGMNVYVREISEQLAAIGVHVDVFTRRTSPDGPAVETLAPGASVVSITAGPAERIEKEELLPLTAEFARGVEEFARAEGHTYDLIHSHYWLSAVAGEELAIAWGVPHVAMFHTLAEVKLRARASEREPEVRRQAERRLVRSVDRIVAATKHERQLLRQIYGVSADRVEVSPLGVNLSRFHSRDRVEARRALNLDLDTHVLLAVGRIEPLKGLDILIEAIALMTERERVVLLIVGGDDRAAPQIARLGAQAAEAGVGDRVRFVGAVPHEQLSAYYNAADVVVVPSFYESFGLVAVEAMASGVPVVASRVGGLASTVVDGRTGYLVPWRCPDPFAEKLDLLLENPSLRHALGAAAADSMLAYEWSTVAAKLRELYAVVLAGRRDLAAVGGG